MRKTLTRMGLGLALVVGAAGAAAAQSTPNARPDTTQRDHRKWDGEHGGRRGGPGGMLLKGINLTDAQKEQMRQISERYRATFRAQRQAHPVERRGGFDALKGGTFDEAAVRAAAQARANAQVEMEVQRAHMMFEMYNVLTPEQKAQLAAERQQREQRRQERRTRRQAEGVTQN